MIRFECSCGKRLKVPPSEIGRTVSCPDCAAQLIVPDPDAPPVAEEVTSGPEALAAAMRQLAPTAAAARPSKIPAKIPPKKTPPAAGRSPLKPGARPAPGKPAANKTVIIIIASVVALGVILLIIAFFGFNNEKPVKKKELPTFQTPSPPPPEPKPERNLHPPGDLFPKVAPTN